MQVHKGCSNNSDTEVDNNDLSVWGKKKSITKQTKKKKKSWKFKNGIRKFENIAVILFKARNVLFYHECPLLRTSAGASRSCLTRMKIFRDCSLHAR